MKINVPILPIAAAILLGPLCQALADPPVTFNILRTFNYPGAVTTTLTGINFEGDAAGFFTPDNSTTYGFIRFRHGISAPILVPNDTRITTRVTGINDEGTICGYYQNKDFHWYGFTASAGTFTPVDSGAADTFVMGINNAGNTCGYTGNPIGSFAVIDGTVIPIAVPGAESTITAGINNLNQCVGFYYVGQNIFGFRRDADGTFTYPIARPGAVVTYLLGINDNGAMTGYAFDSSAISHGIYFESPNRSVLYDYPGTNAVTSFWGINNRGLITGSFAADEGSGDFIVRAQLATGAD